MLTERFCPVLMLRPFKKHSANTTTQKTNKVNQGAVLVRVFFIFLYSIVNFMRILLLCDPPDHFLLSCFKSLLLTSKIISIVLQPLTCKGIAWQRFFSVSICLVVDVPQLKEDLLPVFIVAFLIQMGIQILKQQRWVKALYFCKQAFIDFFNSSV